MRRYLFERLGWLGPVVLVVTVIFEVLLLRLLFGNGYFNAEQHWYLPVIFLMVGCLAMTAVGVYLNGAKRGIVLDRFTHEPRKAPAHTFLLVPVEYSGALMFALLGISAIAAALAAV